MRDDKGRFVEGHRPSPDTEFKEGEHWREERPHWSESWLRERYHDREMSAAEIADEAGCTENNILYWMEKHGIARRTTSEARSVKHWALEGRENGMHGRTGPNNPAYIDGSSPLRQRMYARGEGRAFLRRILRRDEYECQRCGAGNTSESDLHVHHIKPWAGNPEHRFDEDNAVTLCRSCHEWVHSKKNEAGETSRPCTPSSQSPDRTGRMSGSPGSDAQDGSNPENNTSENSASRGRDTGPSRSSDRTAGKCRCSCDVYTLEDAEVSHFAVYPPNLIPPCIKAGTSQRGQCVECGAPWEREIEEGEPKPPASRPDTMQCQGNGHATQLQKGSAKACWSRERETVGWTPTCDCDADTEPQLVLDPFCGAGTTGVVCTELGRRFLGIELNPEYAEMARDRIMGTNPTLFGAAP